MKSENFTIKRLLEGYSKKEFTPKEIFSHYLEKIKNKNKDLNAYLSVFESVESPLKEDSSLPLFGIPCAIKDNTLVEGAIATAGSKILNNYVSAFDATAVAKIKKAGGRILGKTNLDEFAMGSSTENSAFGVVKNPHDLNRVAGGSSGGSAVAVAADLAVFSLGSDTGGSVRQPASFCGVVGLKPSYGRVSRHGLIALASSLDQIGPFTKTVEDSALVMNIIAGQDKFDSTTIAGNVPDFSLNLDKTIKGLKVGIPEEYFGQGMSGEVREKVDEAISYLEGLGCAIVPVSLPHSGYALAVYYIVLPCEASSNLARFDGIRYGHSARGVKNLIEAYLASRAEGFGPEPKRRIMLGTYALSSGYYDAYYLKAQKVRALIKKDFDDVFEKVDVIVGPTAPTTAFKIGEKSQDPLAMYLSDIYTVPVNLAGLPAVSIPIGLGQESKLPVGLQIIGRSFDEETILKVANHLEKQYGR